MKNSTVCSISGGQYKYRDPAVSIVRVTAFLMIIICHIMQYFGLELAWWFNVGVQMFLCLSGYLYGKRTITDDLSFYRRQFIKILMPYYFVIVLVIMVQVLFLRDQISAVQAIKALLVYGTLSGGGHLWFISTILFCYILTPLFDKVNNSIFEKKRPERDIVLVFVLISVTVKLFVGYFNPAWIVCYYIGSVIGKNEIKQKIAPLIIRGIIVFFAMGLVSVQIMVNYVLNLNFTGYIQKLYNIMCDYGHTFLGVSIVVLMLDIFRYYSIKRVWKVIAVLDSISYEGYLVHQFLILGPMSILSIIKSPGLAIILIFVLTCSLGFIVKKIIERLKTL